MPETSDKSIPTLASELLDLVRAYAKQETIEPLKGIGRWLAFGLAGSLLVGTGLLLLAVGALRALQTETGDTFDGNWSWAPYLIVLAGCAVVIALVASRIGKKAKR
jgi:hypothetical protein